MFSSLFSNEFDKAVEYYQNRQYKEAYEIFKELASQDNAHAQYNLSLMYQHGLGIEKTFIKVLIGLKKLSKKKTLKH